MQRFLFVAEHPLSTPEFLFSLKPISIRQYRELQQLKYSAKKLTNYIKVQ